VCCFAVAVVEAAVSEVAATAGLLVQQPVVPAKQSMLRFHWFLYMIQILAWIQNILTV
jgi:hypothetical protein